MLLKRPPLVFSVQQRQSSGGGVVEGARTHPPRLRLRPRLRVHTQGGYGEGPPPPTTETRRRSSPHGAAVACARSRCVPPHSRTWAWCRWPSRGSGCPAAPPWPPVSGEAWNWKAATSKADPRQQQDWILKCLQGGRVHPLAACGVAALCSSPLNPNPRYGRMGQVTPPRVELWHWRLYTTCTPSRWLVGGGKMSRSLSTAGLAALAWAAAV